MRKVGEQSKKRRGFDYRSVTRWWWRAGRVRHVQRLYRQRLFEFVFGGSQMRASRSMCSLEVALASFPLLIGGGRA